MKTFLVYSKKPMKFISSVKDISNVHFVKYGFNWLYLIDFLNIFHSMKRKFFVITVMLVSVYVLFSSNSPLKVSCIVSIALLAYALEGFFLKTRKYQLVATIEAKNTKQAKELFVKDYILQRNRVFIDRS
jgi:hypothetical protein